jgi:epoxyqueuosine reductase
LIDKTIEANKCISYFTIELKSNQFPQGVEKQSENWVFGCDICQDVCPWNRFSTQTSHKELEPFEEVIHFNIKNWMELNEDEFNIIFKDSPLKRSKFEGIKRNLRLFQS